MYIMIQHYFTIIYTIIDAVRTELAVLPVYKSITAQRYANIYHNVVYTTVPRSGYA